MIASADPQAGHATLRIEPKDGALTVTCRCAKSGSVPSEDHAWLWWKAHQATADMNTEEKTA